MNTGTASPEVPASGARRWLRHPLLSPLNVPEDWDRLASAINPLWSLSESRARLVRIVNEAPGVKSLWLKPNRHFKG
ncbi:MAG: hypothetical protein WBP53_04950, partial [Dokdonella sp.]